MEHENPQAPFKLDNAEILFSRRADADKALFIKLRSIIETQQVEIQELRARLHTGAPPPMPPRDPEKS